MIMFNQKKIEDLIDRLNKSGNEVQRLENENRDLKDLLRRAAALLKEVK